MTGQQLIDSAALSIAGHAYIRCRDPKWANPEAYMRLSVIESAGKRSLGPWVHLFDRVTQEAIGERTPQVVLVIMAPFNLRAFVTQDYDPWLGALDVADTGSNARAPQEPTPKE